MAKKRRGWGEGRAVELPDGRWRALLSAGVDPATGKRVRPSKVCQTKKEALEWLAAQQASRGRGPGADARRWTVGAWVEHWLAGKAGEVEWATHRFYRQRYERWVRADPLAGVKLADLTGTAVQSWMNRLTDAGASKDARKKALKTLRAAVADAVRKEVIRSDPSKAVKMPRAAKPEMHPLTHPQALALIAAADRGRMGAFVRLGLDAGCRPSEMLALHWPEVRLDAGTVGIRWNLVYKGKDGGFELKPPKTAAGRRTVLIASATVAALKSHREVLRAEGRDVESGPVFPGRKSGGFLQLSELSRHYFRPARRAAGLSCRPMDLRHTSATLLLGAGVSIRVIAQRLGHESPEITLRHYASFLPEHLEAARQAAESLWPADGAKTEHDIKEGES